MRLVARRDRTPELPLILKNGILLERRLPIRRRAFRSTDEALPRSGFIAAVASRRSLRSAYHSRRAEQDIPAAGGDAFLFAAAFFAGAFFAVRFLCRYLSFVARLLGEPSSPLPSLPLPSSPSGRHGAQHAMHRLDAARQSTMLDGSRAVEHPGCRERGELPPRS